MLYPTDIVLYGKPKMNLLHQIGKDNWPRNILISCSRYGLIFIGYSFLIYPPQEYCLVDLSQYRQQKLALRWRTEDEVLSGKGHFFCGSLSCSRREELRSWEVPFAYVEHGEHRKVMVKMKLCFKCSKKLLACNEKDVEEEQSGTEEKRPKRRPKLADKVSTKLDDDR